MTDVIRSVSISFRIPGASTATLTTRGSVVRVVRGNPMDEANSSHKFADDQLSLEPRSVPTDSCYSIIQTGFSLGWISMWVRARNSRSEGKVDWKLWETVSVQMNRSEFIGFEMVQRVLNNFFIKNKNMQKIININ